MKNCSVIVLILFSFNYCLSQNRIEGTYKSKFGQTIQLNSNNTFLFRSSFDLSSSWSQGKWKTSNDTIYLEVEIIKDTLYDRNYKTGIVKDTLVISQDAISNRISYDEFIVGILSSGGQNRVKPPSKVFFRNNKLHLINELGRIDKRQLKHFWINKKYKTYFKKTLTDKKQINN